LTFKLYILVLFLTFVRPIDGFFPELLEYRPMLILYGLCAVVTLINFAGLKAVKNEAQTIRATILVVTFIAALCLSHVANGWLGGALKAISDQSPTIALFALTILNVNTLERFSTACKTVLLAIFMMGSLAIVAFHSGLMFDLLVLKQSASESAVGPSNILLFGDPNDMAQAMVTCIPFLLGAWVPKAVFRNLVFRLFPLLVLLYAIYLTQSRGAIFGLGAIVFYWLYRRFGTTLTLSALGLSGFGLLALGVGGGRSLSSDEASASERIDAWGQGFTMFKSHPLFGVGYDQFLEHHILTAHNSFVLCFAELGLFGYFVWIGFIVLAFLQLNAVIRANRSSTIEKSPAKSWSKNAFTTAQVEKTQSVNVNAERWSGVLRASLLGFLACGFFLSRTYSLTLFFLLAMAYSIAKMSVSKSEMVNLRGVTTSRWFLLTAFWVIASMVIIYGSVRIGNL
jgi:putative inorganic carbon (hco3(-)) transporter